MPLTWTVSHADRLVFASGRGVVALDDFTAYLRALTDAKAMAYGKLVDLSYTELQLRAPDVRVMAAHVNAYAVTGGVVGPLAIVVDVELSAEASRLFDVRTSEVDRPLRVFTHVAEARQWLESVRSARDLAGGDKPAAGAIPT